VLIKSRLNSPVRRVLIFSLLTDQRDSAAVFERLAASLVGSGIEHVIFTTYQHGDESDSRDSMQTRMPNMNDSDIFSDTDSDAYSAIPKIQQSYADIWKRSHYDTNIDFQPTIKRSLDVVSDIGKDCGHVQTLITGSQHLVGGALHFLQPSSTV
jgi:folylpolyglutamate synthase